MRNEKVFRTFPGFLMLVERELYRLKRIFYNAVIPPVLNMFFFVVIFGYSIGASVKNIDGYPYVIYILPGLIAMGVVSSTFMHSGFSIFLSKYDKSIENLMVAPIMPYQIALGFVLGALSRGLAVGSASLLLSFFMLDFHIHNGWLLFLYISLISVCFGSWGIVGALWSESFDQINLFINYVVTPLTYLGGVFFSISMLPDFWKGFSQLNPVLYMVDGFRFALLGVNDISPMVSGGVIFGLTVTSFLVAVWLFKIGYKIVH